MISKERDVRQIAISEDTGVSTGWNSSVVAKIIIREMSRMSRTNSWCRELTERISTTLKLLCSQLEIHKLGD